MIGHGVVSLTLLFGVGVLYDRYHTRSLKQYSGLVQVMPLFSTIFFIFTLANRSFPGTSNFVGELLIFIGILRETGLLWF
jgi:NADH-quinone oxidoreductase subunit M